MARNNRRRDAFLTPATSSLLLLGDHLRGGSAATKDSEDDTDESEAEEDDEDNEEEESEAEEEGDTEDEYDSEEEEEEEEVATKAGKEIEETASEFDEPLVANPMTQLYATFGVMMLAKRVDLYNPTLVKIARFAFIGYLVVLQLFVLYARIQAKSKNDRTPISTSNPLTNLMQSQLQGPDNSNAMMKNLASSFLSSESTVMEYDLKQARSMQGGLLFNMCFMWFLHFKMDQMQPLLINSVTGIMNMVYSPLFQVHVMGRNLERPFKNPAAKGMEAAVAPVEDDSAAATEAPIEEEEEEAPVAEEEEEDSDDGSDDDDDDDDDSDASSDESSDDEEE